MTLTSAAEPIARRPLRLWPGIVAAALAWTMLVGVPLVAPSAGMVTVLGGAIGGLLVLLWWLFWSRAPWIERVGALVVMAVAVLLTKLAVHPSVAGAGMGMLFYVYAIPVLALALVAWAVGTRRLADGPRRAWLVATILLASGIFLVLRVGGISNTQGIDFKWRWSKTAEERLLAEKEPAKADAPRASAPGAATTAHQPEWPGFRGPNRDSVVHGVSIATDWSKSPPKELWRRPIGPGWSSFAIDGDRVYTQEQLGGDELVSCYDLATGQPVWRHRDATRFWEANAGAGPRATPTLHDGRVYGFGATGILNALDARDGSVIWTHDVAKDTEKEVPYWGFASSPLVAGDRVIVAASGKLAGYDIASGDLRWVGPKGGGYSSPHLATIAGVEQILILNGAGAVSVAPEDGKLLWSYDWPGDGIVQPGITEDGDILIGSGSGMGGNTGLRRVAVTRAPGEWDPERGAGGWTFQEKWTSTGLKPYFNDFVIDKGFAYGFDGGILACVSLDDGSRKWKGGRYGDGQLLLLADQDLLLVLSEKGELALVDARPDQFNERAKFKAIESKTWNHPAMDGDVVLVRNGEEMAAFRLASAGG
jgi:outer membrane protein assembly factor BamB